MPTVENRVTKHKKIRGGRKRRQNTLEKQKKILHKELLDCPEKVEQITAKIATINGKIQTIPTEPSHCAIQDENEELLIKLLKLQSLLLKSIQ